MYKIIGGDGKEYGPVSAEELRHWIAEGRLNAQSWVRLDTATEWKALGTFPEFTEMLRTQQVQADAPPQIGGALQAPTPLAQISAMPRHIAVGSCLARSFALLKSNVGLLFGAVFVVWIFDIVAALTPFSVGQLIYFPFKGPLYGGLALVFLKRIRGEPTSASAVFSGFKRNLLQLILAGVVTGLLEITGACCCLVPGIYLWVAWVFAVPLVADRGFEFWSAMELSRKVVTRIWFEVFGLALLAFATFLLAMGIAQIRAMVGASPVSHDVLRNGQPDMKQLLEAFYRMLQPTKEERIQMIVIQIVRLLNWPFALGALMYAYEDLFGARKSQGA